MASTVVLASSNLIHSIEYSKQFPNLCLAIGKKRAVVGFQDQPLHLGGTVASRQARRGFLLYSIQPGNHHPPTGDSLSSWQQWIGMITALIVPFFSRKWIKLLKIKGKKIINSLIFSSLLIETHPFSLLNSCIMLIIGFLLHLFN
ncbi:hypothetical protein Hdeb2414_s0015g00453271 [Helianthus debilis subsp. tardiflorus]